MLRITVFNAFGDEDATIILAGDCLATPREQALDWLHSNGYAYQGTFREGEHTWDAYEDIRTNLFHATLEEL